MLVCQIFENWLTQSNIFRLYSLNNDKKDVLLGATIPFSITPSG